MALRTVYVTAKRNQQLATIVINRGPTGPKGDPGDVVGGGIGDMVAATYDPQGIEGDAFAMANMTEGADAKVMTAAERNAIAALGTASTREADQNLRTTDAVEFDTVTADTVNLHAAAFDTTNGGPTTLGEMAWDSVDGTLDIQADGGVKIAVGEDGMIRVRNTSGTTIAKGAPLVYAGTTGASGKLEVGPWEGANVTNARTFLGFAAGEMANNADGYATWFGKIAEIPTDGGAELWDDGDILYAIPGASATLSNIRPTSGEFVTAAVVINAGSGTSGSIFVRPTFDSISSISGVSYGDLDDAATVDLPTVNTPLATALGLKADASSLATVATSGSYADLSGTPTLATVATSGDYGDLLNRPTLVVNFGDLGDATTVDLPTVNNPLSTALGLKADTASLSTVATSGAYSDLTGTPTIPSGTQVEDYLVDVGIHTITSFANFATPDANNGRSQKFPLTENTTLNLPSNLADGQSMTIAGTQAATPVSFSIDPLFELYGAGKAPDVTGLGPSEGFEIYIKRVGSTYRCGIITQQA